MAKLVIEIEDLPDGSVRLAGSPDMAQILALAYCPDEVTPAEGYALAAWGALLDLARGACGSDAIAAIGASVKSAAALDLDEAFETLKAGHA
jgi:hypothetical protein